MKTEFILACVVMAISITSANGQSTGALDVAGKLDSESAKAWKKHILPTEEELAWTKIDWLPDLKSGIEEASKSDKPILLWTMNGHPFGCT